MELAGASHKPVVIALVGPTASGKTELAIRLSEVFKSAEIVSADSRQIYRSMDIGTAKPTIDQLQKCRHHFIDILDPNQEYSAGKYGSAAHEKVIQLLKASTVPIVCGGSGLYLKALFEGLVQIPDIPPEIRTRVRNMVKTNGNQYIYNLLTEIDPIYSKKTDATKIQRNCRALEVFYSTGRPFSSFHNQKNTSRNQFKIIKIGLAVQRTPLYHRINLRVDEMIAKGLVEETRNMLNAGFDPELRSFRTVGYQEIIQYLARKASLKDTIQLIKQHTRNYAKRQMTWFNADSSIHWIDGNSETTIDQKLHCLLAHIRQNIP